MDADPYPNAAGAATNPNSAAGGALVRGASWRLGLLAAVAAVAMAATVAGQVAPTTADITGLQLDSGRVVSSIAVLDSASNPVEGLTAADFSAQIDGRAVPAEVGTGVDAALPIGLILTVDTSGSMQGQALAAAKQAMLPLIEALQASDEAALVTFANQVSEAVPLTNDGAVLAAAVDSMAAAGNTALYAAVVRASEVATAAPQPRRAVVFLSDGEDFGSVSGGITAQQALESARSAGAPFFVVGLGQAVDQPFLTSLARDTRGQYFAATDPDQLAQLYARISDRLRRQYSVSVQLPDDLPGGTHRLTIAVGGVVATATFDTEGTATIPRLVVLPIPEVITEETRVAATGAPPGASIKFELNGVELGMAPGGREVTIDPYRLAPGPYQLIVATDPPGAAESVSYSFAIADLPPILLAPSGIPNLRPGDLVRLTVRVQPGAVTARFFVDGIEAAVIEEEPFEFVLPMADYRPGEHELRVMVASDGGVVERSWQFSGPVEPGTNYAAYLLLALAALAACAGAGYGGWRGFRWYRARPEPIDVSGVGEQLAAWSELRRGRGTLADSSPVLPPERTPWGTIVVLAGPDAGKNFDLFDDAELVGRGAFCSVRLADPSVDDAHFVVSRDGKVAVSTPTARVVIDGQPVRSAVVGAALDLTLGDTQLAIRRVDDQA